MFCWGWSVIESARSVECPRTVMRIMAWLSARRVGLLSLGSITLQVFAAIPALGSLPETSTPSLQLARTIRTTPFINTTVSMRDGEGSAYVPRNNSLWLAEDNSRSVYGVNPDTGDLKRVIDRTAFESAHRFGGGPAAGEHRDGDLESMAYDEAHDILYAFSGTCCTSAARPTAFRLKAKHEGAFHVESYQRLPTGSDFTAAAWNPGDGKLYVGVGSDLRTYDYETNSRGPVFQVPSLSRILGMSFSSDGAHLYIVTGLEKLDVVDWMTKTIEPGWSLDLTPFGVLNSRAVELINDQFYVLDGKERPRGDPLRFAVFVLNVLAATTTPTASFNTSPSSGRAPLRVAFIDTSSNAPASWSWNFGDGITSALENPTHVYGSPGMYTVTLTVANPFGSSTAQVPITVLE